MSSEKAWEWLEGDRALDVTLLTEMGFSTGTSKDGAQDLVKIPYARNGDQYLAKFRTAGEEKRFWCHPGGVEKSLWNVDALRQDLEQPIILTEGEFDAVSCIQAGFDRVASIPDGWNVQSDDHGAKMRPLIEVEDLLRSAPYVIVASDADAVGASFMLAVRRLLEGHGKDSAGKPRKTQDVRYCEWPEGCKDANDVLKHHGAAALARCLNSAKRLDPPGMRIYAPSELPPEEPRRVLRPGGSLHRCIALELGQISISTGVPGHGKSTFATFLADEIQREERIRVGMCMMETPKQRLRDHLSILMGRAPWADLGCDDRKRLDNAYRIVTPEDFDDEGSHDFGWVKDMVFTLAARDQCKLILIDPWNEIDHSPMRGESMTQYANAALTKLRQWAQAAGCHIHLIAHPRKMPNGDIPRGYDIADSAAFVNKPALGWTVYQPEDPEIEHTTEIHVWKVRDQELYGFGRRATKLQYQHDIMSFEAI